MGQRLLVATQKLIGAVVAAFQWWFRQIGRQDTLRAKALVAAAGLLALCVVCSFPVALVNGPRTPTPVAKATAAPAAAAAQPTEVPLATRAPEPAALAQQATDTPVPTDMPSPTATPQPTNTPESTNTPELTATPTATSEPTATPKPTAVPKPTARPKPTAKPAANPLNTHGADRYNCSDFATYAQAYAVYKANLPGDPNGLDRDHDGIPCESLPGAP